MGGWVGVEGRGVGGSRVPGGRDVEGRVGGRGEIRVRVGVLGWRVGGRGVG